MRQGTEFTGRGKREEGRGKAAKSDAGAVLRTTGFAAFSLPPSLFPLPRLRRVLSALRTIFGMPDYAGYVEHCRLRHPDQPILTREEHYAQHLARRYGNGPSRCC